jgi:hypothetical protein
MHGDTACSRAGRAIGRDPLGTAMEPGRARLAEPVRRASASAPRPLDPVGRMDGAGPALDHEAPAASPTGAVWRPPARCRPRKAEDPPGRLVLGGLGCCVYRCAGRLTAKGTTRLQPNGSPRRLQVGPGDTGHTGHGECNKPPWKVVPARATLSTGSAGAGSTKEPAAIHQVVTVGARRPSGFPNFETDLHDDAHECIIRALTSRGNTDGCAGGDRRGERLCGR